MMLHRPTFIVFEGLDGSGKSTCAAALAAQLEAVLMTTPTPNVRAYRDDLILSLGASQEARQLFYLATVFAASREVTALLDQGRSVVLDRYFLSTQAYAAFRGSALCIDDVQRLLKPADITLYMDAALTTRVARLQQRGTSLADLETFSATADNRLREEHMQRARLAVLGRFIVVDSELGKPQEVIEHILSMLAHEGLLR